MSLPLSSLRVIALEQAVAGPFCSRNLCDMGADVIKIEPLDGDFARAYDSVVNGLSSYFVWLSRGKRSLAVNLRTPEGKQILRELVLGADVLVTNLAPGAPGRLGLEYEELSQHNPGLIWAGISGYGTDGPYRDRKGFDLLLQGEAGVIAATGYPDAPAKVGFSVADECSGFYAYASVLMALIERHETGRGRRIDISILDCLAEWMMPQAYFAMFQGRDLPRAGMRHNIIVPYGPYRAGDGRMVNLAVQNQGQWERLCRVALGRADLISDPRFATNAERVRNREILEPLIEELFSGLTSQQVVARLVEADVPFGMLNDATDLAIHPQLVERNRVRQVETPNGPAPAFLPPHNLIGLEPRLGPVPALGEHSDAVLRELGYSDDRVAALREAGVIR